MGLQNKEDIKQDMQLQKVFGHIEVINSEMGRIDTRVSGLEKTCSSIKSKIANFQVDIATVTTDMRWIKKFFWIVATASVAGMIGTFINMAFNR